MGEKRRRSEDDFRIVRGEAHKDKGQSGGAVRPPKGTKIQTPLQVLVWPKDTGRYKEKDKPGSN